jgi:hypothetical protein
MLGRAHAKVLKSGIPSPKLENAVNRKLADIRHCTTSLPARFLRYIVCRYEQKQCPQLATWPFHKTVAKTPTNGT